MSSGTITRIVPSSRQPTWSLLRRRAARTPAAARRPARRRGGRRPAHAWCGSGRSGPSRGAGAAAAVAGAAGGLGQGRRRRRAGVAGRADPQHGSRRRAKPASKAVKGAPSSGCRRTLSTRTRPGTGTSRPGHHQDSQRIGVARAQAASTLAAQPLLPGRPAPCGPRRQRGASPSTRPSPGRPCVRPSGAGPRPAPVGGSVVADDLARLDRAEARPSGGSPRRRAGRSSRSAR